MTLEELVARYGSLKTEMDSYKKQVDSDNKDIKSLMSKLKLSEAHGGGYVAKYSVSVSEGFDDDKLVSLLSNMSINGKSAESLGIIVYKPTVDMGALENAIYNGFINAADLSDCRTRKETPRLTISKEK